MKVGIIGSGGREHSICQSISNSSNVEKIFVFLVTLVLKILQKMSKLI